MTAASFVGCPADDYILPPAHITLPHLSPQATRIDLLLSISLWQMDMDKWASGGAASQAGMFLNMFLCRSRRLGVEEVKTLVPVNTFQFVYSEAELNETRTVKRTRLSSYYKYYILKFSSISNSFTLFDQVTGQQRSSKGFNSNVINNHYIFSNYNVHRVF